MALPKLLDLPQVAQIIGCSRQHAHDLASRGELGQLVDITASTSGKRTKTRITEDGVAAFIERRSRSALTAAS